MITKAFIVKKLPTNKYLVRIPYLEDTTGSNSLHVASILEATAVMNPGTLNVYKEGDCVFVAFENIEQDKPVILGLLYKGNEYKELARAHQYNDSLTVTNKAKLPINTTIGKITYQDLITAINSSGVGEFAPIIHNHSISEVTGLQAALDNKADKEDSIFYISGTGTVAGTWLGTNPKITEYYDGLTISYKIPIAGASSTTLNINNLGAIRVRRNAGNLTTHLPVNTVVLLTYTTISSVGYWVWADYDDTSSLITQAEINAGTSTTVRGINASLLRTNFYLKSESDSLLENKVNKNNAITAGTKAKITYDAKGLVTAGADLTADDIPTHQHTKSEITNFPTIPTVPTISTDITTDATSDAKTVSPKAVKTYVDNAISTAIGDLLGGES